MIKRVKSSPEDNLILLDETADVNDRENSATRLAFDGFFDLLRPVLDKWLINSEFLLRSRAITFFLGRIGDEKYYEKAVQMLQEDSNWIVRKSSIEALRTFSADFDKGKDYIQRTIKEMLYTLINDQDEAVQAKSYQVLHELITGKNWDIYEHINYFDCQRDVDWKLLQPYLEKYNLKKPVLS